MHVVAPVEAAPQSNSIYCNVNRIEYQKYLLSFYHVLPSWFPYFKTVVSTLNPWTTKKGVRYNVQIVLTSFLNQ